MSMSRMAAHAVHIHRALKQGAVNWTEKQAAVTSFEPILTAAKCWEQFAAVHPQEAQLIEAGVSVADALRSKA